MKKLIIDLEATCTNANEFPRHESEIIEIGAVLVNENNEIVSKYNTFIKPVRNPKITKFCTELTSIVQSDVDDAPGFKEAIADFTKYMNAQGDFIFCSWGNYDKNQFRRDSEYHQIQNCMEKYTHVNIKEEFARTQGIKPRGLMKALGLLGLDFEGNYHRGIDDAINMAKLIGFINFPDK